MSDKMGMVEESERKLKPKRRRNWRKVNTIILLISLFSPWISSCYGEVVLPGGGVVLMGVLSILEKLALEHLLESISGVAFVVYFFLNALRAFKSNKPKNSSWLTISVIGAVVFLSIIYFRPRIDMNGDIEAEMMWGYWLAWAGVASSSLLEISKPDQ